MTTAILVALLATGVLFVLLKSGQKPTPQPTWLKVAALVYLVAMTGLWITYGVLTGAWLLVAAVLVPTCVGACIGVGQASGRDL